VLFANITLIHLFSELPLALAACNNQKQTKITSYVKLPPSAKLLQDKSDKDYHDDNSLSIKEILPEDEEASNGSLFDDFIPTVKHNINNSYLISQFLAANGYDHVDIVYNLHSGIHPAMITAEVAQNGLTLLIYHALCPVFHDLSAFIKLIKKDCELEDNYDNAVRFRHLQEVACRMKGESTVIHAEKTTGLPFPCQQVPCLQGAINTPQCELILFLELCSVHQMVHDNKIQFVIDHHKKPKFYRHDEH